MLVHGMLMKMNTPTSCKSRPIWLVTDAAQRVEVLAHVRRMRIQEEPVGIRQAEHPLSPYRYQLAERLCGDLSGQMDSRTVGKDDFADRMSHFHRVYPLSAGSFFF